MSQPPPITAAIAPPTPPSVARVPRRSRKAIILIALTAIAVVAIAIGALLYPEFKEEREAKDVVRSMLTELGKGKDGQGTGFKDAHEWGRLEEVQFISMVPKTTYEGKGYDAYGYARFDRGVYEFTFTIRQSDGRWMLKEGTVKKDVYGMGFR
jgi:hypothetical protein